MFLSCFWNPVCWCCIYTNFVCDKIICNAWCCNQLTVCSGVTSMLIWRCSSYENIFRLVSLSRLRLCWHHLVDVFILLCNRCFLKMCWFSYSCFSSFFVRPLFSGYLFIFQLCFWNLCILCWSGRDCWLARNCWSSERYCWTDCFYGCGDLFFWHCLIFVFWDLRCDWSCVCRVLVVCWWVLCIIFELFFCVWGCNFWGSMLCLSTLTLLCFIYFL